MSVNNGKDNMETKRDPELAELHAIHDRQSQPQMTVKKLYYLLESFAAVYDEESIFTTHRSPNVNITKISGVWRDKHGNLVIGYQE